MDVNAEDKTALPSEWLEKIAYQEKLAEKNLKQTPISKVTTYTDTYGSTPEIDESLDVQLESNNPVDKYTVRI